MKQMFHTVFGELVSEFKALGRKQRWALVYYVLSIYAVLIFACSDSLTAVFLAGVNLVNATRVGKKHGIPYIPE